MNITIYKPNGDTISAPVTQQAEHTQELMKSDEIALSWSDIVSQTIPMGSYISYNNVNYYLYEPYKPQTTDGYEYKYTPTFQSEFFRLAKVPFMLYTLEDGVVTAVETDWNFTGDRVALASALKTAIYNGIGIEYEVEISEELTKALILSFSNVDIISALSTICAEWECEWWTDSTIGGTSRTLYIGKSIVHGEVYTLTEGDNVQNTSTKTQTTFYNRFYVFGSDRNIPQDYSGATATQIVNKRLTLDPTKYPNGYIDLPKFDDNGNMVVDTNGDIIYDDSVGGMVFSKVIMLEDIYPKSDLKVSNVVSVTRYMRDDNDNIVYLDEAKTIKDTYQIFYLQFTNSDGELFTINASTYDKTKNPNGSLIKGKTLSLHMSSGALTGREFELTYHREGKSVKGDDGVSVTIPANSYEVIFTQDNTIVIPNTNIAPVVDDTAIIFNIRMPQTYIDNAYTRLEEEAIKTIYDETRDRNAYTLKSNVVAFANDNPNLTLGRQIKFVKGGGDYITTRVSKLVTKLDRPSEQTITLCKEVSKGSITTIVESIQSTKREVYEVSVKDDKAVQEATRKAFRAQRELQDMVFDTDGYFDGGKIRPETIETLLLSVGATSTNFTLQNVLLSVKSNILTITSNSGKLIHYGIDTDNIKTWSVSTRTQTLTASTAYYIYAQCSESGTGCTILADTAQYKYNALLDTQDVYMFLVGTISSDGILSLTYGASTISGGQVKTGRIQSNDGNTYFDLDSGVIGGNISFKSSSDYSTLEDLIGVAQDTADSATSKADNAQTTADTAQTSANTAQSTANEANSNATTALTTATTAKESVDNLQVGGRNLALKTDVISSHTTTSSYGKVMYYLSPTLYEYPLVAGTQLCLSYERQNTAINRWLTLEPPYLTIKAFYSASTDGAWVKDVIVITLSNGWTPTSNTPFIAIGSSTNGATIKIRNLKLELGNKPTDWTPAPEDVDTAIATAESNAISTAKTYAEECADGVLTQAQADIAEYDYLKKAYEQSTEIQGGIVATNAVLLRENEEVVAGISGNENVRFWSGGTLAEALSGNTNFRVTSNGELNAISAILKNAIITSGDGTNDIDISGGSISLKKDGTLLTQILAQTLGTTIDVGLSKFVSSLGTPSTASFDVLLSGSTSTMAYDYTGVTGGMGTNSIQIGLSGSGEKTIFTASADGTLTFKANISVTTTIQIPSRTCTRSDEELTPIELNDVSVSWGSSPTTNITLSILDSNNNVVFSGTPTAVSGKSFNVVSGRTYRMRVSCNYTNYLSAYCDKPSDLDLETEGEWFYLTPSWNNGTIQKITIPQVSFNGTATAYNNKIFNDGLIMSSDSDSYVAIAPKSTADIFRFRHGTAMYKLVSGVGLVFRNSTSGSFYLANPMVLVVRLTYDSSNSSYTPVTLFDPTNRKGTSGYGKCTRLGTGVVNFVHNLGHTYYTVVGTNSANNNVTGYVSGNMVRVNATNRSANDCNIVISYTSNADLNCEIVFYSYQTFS